MEYKEEEDTTKPIFDIDEEEEEDVEEEKETITKKDTTKEEEDNSEKEEEEEEEEENKNMALTTRMSQTITNVSHKVYSYFQKGSSVVFRWFWVGGIIFWIVGLPLIRTRGKQIQFDELLAKFSYKVKELNSAKKPRFKHI